MKSEYYVGMVVGFLLVVLFFGVLAKIARKNSKAKEEFDERQLFERGKAYQCGFITFIFEFAFALVYNAAGFELPVAVDPLCWYGFGLFLALAVFSFVAVSRDAFFAANATSKTSYILYACICGVNLLAGLVNVGTGNITRDGVLVPAGGFMNLLLAVLFGVIIIASIIRDKRSAAEEED